MAVTGRRNGTTDRINHYVVAASAATVHWGYLSRSLKPVLSVDSGDFVTIETLTHHAYDDYARMIEGDPGAESVFLWTKDAKNVDRRGAGPMDASIHGRGAGEGFGVHICTGPVFVRDAEPGDVLEVRIIDVRPRGCCNPAFKGRAFGSNAAAWWGFHYNDLLTEPKPREVITIYEIDATGDRNWARAVYNYRWVPQTDPIGVVHRIIDYPGVLVNHALVEEKHGILKDVRIPVRPHFGVIALAPKEAEFVDSVPPGYFGGNVDDWRIDYPLLETSDEWVVHGFSFANYLAELGDKAQTEIFAKSSLESAMRDAFRKMRHFLMTAKGLSEDEAISLMSVAVDFGVTQVVDANWGIHAILKKAIFAGEAG
jgi:acetamidase/formamidase